MRSNVMRFDDSELQLVIDSLTNEKAEVERCLALDGAIPPRVKASLQDKADSIALLVERIEGSPF